MRRRTGVLGAALGLTAAAAGTVLVADRRITSTRRVAVAAQHDYAPPRRQTG